MSADRSLAGLFLAFLLGFGAAYFWRGHQATEAERDAAHADSLYQAARADSAQRARERQAFDSVRAAEVAASDSSLRAATDSVAALKGRVAVTSVRHKAALAAAVTAQDTIQAQAREIDDLTLQRDRALALADTFARASGRLRAVVAKDSVEMGKERRETARWQGIAATLDSANQKLMANRRPGFDLKLGAGSFTLGVAVGVVVRSLFSAKPKV